MKVEYRGFDIEATREECMAGYELLYYHVTRLSDLWVPIDSYSDTSDTVQDYIGYLKESVDDIIANPQDWEDQWTNEHGLYEEG